MLSLVFSACYGPFTAFEATNSTVVINLTASNDSNCSLEYRVAISATLECPEPQIIYFQRAIFTEHSDLSLSFTCRDTLTSYQQLCESLLLNKGIDFHNSLVRLRQIDGREDLLSCGCTADSGKLAFIIIGVVCIIAAAAAITFAVIRCRKPKYMSLPAYQSSYIMNYDDYSDDSGDSISFLKRGETAANGSY